MLKNIIIMIVSFIGAILILIVLFRAGFIEFPNNSKAPIKLDPSTIKNLTYAVETGSEEMVKAFIRKMDTDKSLGGLSHDQIEKLIFWKNFLSLQDEFDCQKIILIYPLEKKLKSIWFGRQQINLLKWNSEATDAKFNRKIAECKRSN